MVAYEAVLFDNDGVLVTPTDRTVLRDAARAAFRTVGIDDPREDHVESLVTGVSIPDLERICETYGVPVERFWRARDETAALAQQVELRADRKTTYDDVSVVQSLDVPLGIVSTNQQRTVEFVLDRFDLRGAFETAYGREPVVASLERKKPATHYVERALADLGVGAERALFVGDSESDLRAAQRAGLDSAFVRRSHVADATLGVEPTHEIERLTALPGLVAD